MKGKENKYKKKIHSPGAGSGVIFSGAVKKYVNGLSTLA